MSGKDTTKELAALIHLLDEPDEKVYATIRSRILALGTRALPLLEEADSNLFSQKEAARMEELINTIRVQDVYEKLKNWSEHQSHDLLEPWLLISGFHLPEEDNEKMKASVEKLYRDVWVEMNNKLTALEKIRVVNHVFYNVYQFDALQGNKPVLPPYLLGNVIRMQRGNPLSMAMLYLIVVQRLGIPVFGVNLPKHLILAYMNGNTLPKPLSVYREEDVLFYINPFNKGAIFRKSEVELYLKQLNIKPQEKFFLPVENKVIIQRLLQELTMLHRKNHHPDKAESIQYLLKAIV